MEGITLDERNVNKNYIPIVSRGKFSNKKHYILVFLAILASLIISIIISVSLYAKMKSYQETLNSDMRSRSKAWKMQIQMLTEHLQNLTNLTNENQVKNAIQDQLQKNYSEKLQRNQNQYHQFAQEYNDSSANLAQRITQSKNQISTLAENQQNLSQTVRLLVQEQSILRHLNSSELNETLIKVENLKHIAFPEAGWFTAWNGYQYKVTSSAGTWRNIRRECQNYGGDLAAAGIRDMNVRRFIKNYMWDTFMWVGLSDIGHEGRYVWLDGVNGTTDNIVWRSGEPNNAGDEDCCLIWEGRTDVSMNDYLCSGGDLHYGLCEKRLTRSE